MVGINKPQSLRRDAAYVYGAYTLRYLSVLVLVPYYGRILGPAAYGTVLAAMSLMALVWMVVNYGFSTTGAREMASSTDEKHQAAVFSRQISARLILLPVGLLIGVVGTVASASLRTNPWFGAMATLLGTMNAVNLGWFYQGLRRFRLSIIFEAMAYPLNVLFVLILVKTSNDGLQALIALSLSTGIAALSAYVVAWRLLKPDALSLAQGIAEIKAASTIFLQSVNSMVMTTGSTYILSVFSTPVQVGYFGSVEKLVSFSLAFLQPAAQVLMPTIAHRTAHSPENVRPLVRKGILFEVGYGLCACAGGWLLASRIIPLAFGKNFGPSVPVMQIMVCAIPFAALTHSLGSYVLIPQRRERWLVLAFIIGNAINLILIAILARGLGGAGVALARVVGECITTFMLVYFIVRLRAKANTPGATLRG